MRKSLTPVITVLLVAAVACLALYALGALGGNGALYVENVEYDSHEFMFSGEIKAGLFSGNGTISLSNGGVFTGSFDGGRFSGDGVFYNSVDTNHADWHFAGVFQNGQASGGAFYFPDGTTITIGRDTEGVTVNGPDWQYYGGFSESGQNGTGSFVFEDGSIYTGGFFNGLADGAGEYADAQGNLIYSGDFREGLFDGQGTYFSPGGWSYEGRFKDGLFDGNGRVVDHGMIIQGIWEEGVQIRRDE